MFIKRIKGPIDHNALNNINHNFGLSDVLKTQINDLVLDSGESNSEVAQARGGNRVLADRLDKTDHRLDKTDQQLAKKANQDEVRLKTVKNELEDMSPTVLAAIEGGEGAEFNLLSIPQDNSVSHDKIIDKAVRGEKISDYVHIDVNDSFELGSISNVNGGVINSTTRIRSKDFIKVPNGFTVNSINESVLIAINIYSEPNLSGWVSNSGWGDQHKVNSDCFVKIVVRYVDNRTVNNVNELANALRHSGGGITSEKLSNNAVTTQKVVDEAITIDKTSFLDVVDIPFEPLHNYGFSTSSGSNLLAYYSNALTYRAYINPYEKVRLKAFNHNRFSIGVSNQVNPRDYQSGEPQGAYTLDSIVAYPELSEFEFTNDAHGKEIYLYIHSQGSEPSQATAIIEGFQVKLNDGYKLQSQSVEGAKSGADEVASINSSRDTSLVLFGVKMTNERDIFSSYQDRPRPVGWLYYNPISHELLYANGSPHNVKKLCEWNYGVTWDGVSGPHQYQAYITKKGDIVFVWRGDLLRDWYSDEINPDGRQNPIVYPSGDYDNPIEVDLGDGIKPTSWLQNCGADYIYNKDTFIFSEYTRPLHGQAHVWKVTEPITNPDNWNITQTIELSGENHSGMKHYHTASYDPYSGVVFTSTGDDDASSKIFMSRDFGDTWEVVHEGDRSYARVLNFLYTEDKVYWSTDDYLHYLISADRGEDGIPDITNATRLYDMRPQPPTYVSCLIEEPYGILFLNRHDQERSPEGFTPVDITFWDIENSEMHTLKSVYPAKNSIKQNGNVAPYGFRVEAANFYQQRGSSEIVMGLANPVNGMDLLNNLGNRTSDTINNIAMEVSKVGSEYVLKVKSIQNKS